MENTEEGGGGRGGRCIMGRAEIDTRAPFRSVKEAVILFGERVLAGEVYANKLNQIRAATINDEHNTSPLNLIVTELEETKQSLEKAREESQLMANYLTCLKQELEETKTQLKQLKSSKEPVLDSEIEDLKFVENAPEVEIKIETPMKRSVKFANPPSLTQVINPEQDQLLERQFSVDRENTDEAKRKKKKKKQLIPLIAAMFTKKKGYHDGASPIVQGV